MRRQTNEPELQGKRIYILNHGMLPGGVERQLYYLANGLADVHRVTVVLCQRKGEFLDLLAKKVEVLDLGIPYRHWLQPSLLVAMVRVLKRDRPEVLISFHGNLHWIAVMAGAVARIKTVCVFPGYPARGKLWMVHRSFFRRADGLVAVSCGVRDSLVDNFGIAAERISVIENAIDTPRIREMAREELTAEEQKLFRGGAVFLSVGRLAKGKGFDHLVSAMAAIRNRCSLIIVGDGPERVRIEELVEKGGLSGKVILVGNQMNPYKFLARSSSFVLASESEGLPTVILEAMCLGVPCICAKYRGGTEGVISHRETGYLVERNDPAALTEAMDFFLSPESGALKEAMAEAGKTLVEEKFSISRYVSRYDGYLQKLGL